MRLSLKILVAILMGIVALVALVYFKMFSQNYFSHRYSISDKFSKIEMLENSLDYEVLRSGVFLYVSQDGVNEKIQALRCEIDALQHDPHFQEEHQESFRLFSQYKSAFEKKVEAIYDFQTANASMKNATMALLAMNQRVAISFDQSIRDDRQFLEFFTKAGSSVILAKNSLDAQMIDHLKGEIESLKGANFKDPNKKEVVERVVSNLHVFEAFFPSYKLSIERIEGGETKREIRHAYQVFEKESAEELDVVTRFSYLLLALYFGSLGVIIYFLTRSEWDARTDHLTRFGNRKAYEIAISSAKDPLLFLVNINKFKNYNDFYGTKRGDQILIQTAHRLLELFPQEQKSSFFRLGGDEFGVLLKNREIEDIQAMGMKLLESFGDKKIIVDELDMTPSISVSASVDFPLLETADMALKSMKKSLKSGFLIYHDGLDLRELVEENLIKTAQLREAFRHDRIIPYFQPIIDLKTGTISKYECLGRICDENAEVCSICDYIDIAKESKYYTLLTKTMIKKSFAAMSSLPFEFSINLSVDDISNEEIVQLLQAELIRYEGIGKRVVFELLESEAVGDYDQISAFITLFREYGCKIAIDDFGSGYSNFAHLLNLKIDLLKIDGSLIRNLDTNPDAFTIVQTIVDFAKKTEMKTVAEFVHSQEIAKIVKEMGIDYAQGFYFHKPAEHIL